MSTPVKTPPIPQDLNTLPQKEQFDPSDPLSRRFAIINYQDALVLTNMLSIFMTLVVGFTFKLPMVRLGAAAMCAFNAAVLGGYTIQRRHYLFALKKLGVQDQGVTLEVQGLKNDNERIQGENVRLTTVNGSQEKEIRGLKEQIRDEASAVTKKNGELSATIESQRKRIEELTEVSDGFKVQYDEEVKISSKLQEENTRLIAGRAIISKENEDLKAERAKITELEKKLEGISLDEKLERNNKIFEQVKSHLEQKNQELIANREERERLKEENEELRRSIETRKKQLQELPK